MATFMKSGEELEGREIDTYTESEKEKEEQKEKQKHEQKQGRKEQDLTEDEDCQNKTSFLKLGLHESILFSLFAQKYFFCANIQKKTIPEIIKRKNVLLHSETGSGKTLCFVIPILQRLVMLKGLDIESDKNKVKVEKKKEEGDKKKNVENLDEDSIQSIYNYFEKLHITNCEIKSVKKINVKEFITYNKKMVEKEENNENMRVEQDKLCKIEENDIRKKREKRQIKEKKKEKRKIKSLRSKLFYKKFQKKENEKIKVYSIIITPTRELSIQIYTLIKRMIFFMRYYFSYMFHNEVGYIEEYEFFINTMLYIGTVKIEKDIQKIKKEKKKKCRYNIIVSTPGKLCRLLNDYKEYFNLSNVKYLILDEGDKLLEKTFLHYINDSIKHLYNAYCTCICSATCLQEEQFYDLFSNKKKEYIKCVNRKNISIKNFQLPQKLENYYIILRNLDKQLFLFKFLNTVIQKNETVVIFFSTCFCVDFFFHVFDIVFNNENDEAKANIIDRIIKINRKYKIYENEEENLLPLIKILIYMKKYMGDNNFYFLKIHRRLKGKERNAAFINILNKKDGKKKVILSTDVMSRGVNINVQWVINYDVANRNMTYVHRSGRTSRFNETGKSLILLNKKEEDYIYFLKNKNVHITNFKSTNMYEIMVKREETFSEKEEELNKQTLEIVKEKKLNIFNGEEKIKSFYQNNHIYDTTNLSNPNNQKERKLNKNKIHILQQNMVESFLKIVSFLVVEYREIYLLAKKAFLSYIEFYKNHQLNFIFKMGSLNLSHLCYNFGLVRVPKFKDGLKVKGYKSLNINTDNIAYKNKEKEKNRKEALELAKQISKKKKGKDKKGNKNKNNGEDSDNDEISFGKDKKKDRWKRIEKKIQKQEEEMDYLNWEENLYKKLKKRKISQEEYDSLIGMDRIEKMLSSNDNLSKRKNIFKNTSIQKKEFQKTKKNRKPKGVKHFIKKLKKRKNIKRKRKR